MEFGIVIAVLFVIAISLYASMKNKYPRIIDYNNKNTINILKFFSNI